MFDRLQTLPINVTRPPVAAVAVAASKIGDILFPIH